MLTLELKSIQNVADRCKFLEKENKKLEEELKTAKKYSEMYRTFWFASMDEIRKIKQKK